VEALVPITFFLSIAAVLILRPITKRLGLLIETMTRDRAAIRSDDATAARTLALMEHINRRMDMMEERLDFTERLIAAPQRRPLSRRSDSAAT
jgi:hypothetical protein